MNLSIHPSVGVAGLGNSTTEICSPPDAISGLPFFRPITDFKYLTDKTFNALF